MARITLRPKLIDVLDDGAISMTATRIYLVLHEGDDNYARLIEASSMARALRFATQPFTARVATQSDLVELLGECVEVEQAEEPKEAAGENDPGTVENGSTE